MAAETTPDLAQVLQHVQARLQKNQQRLEQGQQQLQQTVAQHGEQLGAIAVNVTAALNNLADLSAGFARIEKTHAAYARWEWEHWEVEAPDSTAAATKGSSSSSRRSVGSSSSWNKREPKQLEGAAVRVPTAAEAEMEALKEQLRQSEARVLKLQGGQREAEASVAAARAARAAAEAEARAAQAKQQAAEDAVAAATRELLSRQAEMKDELATVQQDKAMKQAECESLRATLHNIREAGRCPILHGLCQEPTVASDGITYDRKAILAWLRQHGTSPLTRHPLVPHLYTNRFATEVLEHLTEIGMGASEVADGDDAQSSVNPQEDAPAPEPGELMAAIQHRNEAAAVALLQHPHLPDLNSSDEDGWTLLHWAIWNNLPDVALTIIARGDFTMINAKHRWGSTALHAAARRGQLHVCNAILDHAQFTELMAVNSSGRTASQWALTYSHYALSEFLRNVEQLRAGGR